MLSRIRRVTPRAGRVPQQLCAAIEVLPFKAPPSSSALCKALIEAGPGIYCCEKRGAGPDASSR